MAQARTAADDAHDALAKAQAELAAAHTETRRAHRGSMSYDATVSALQQESAEVTAHLQSMQAQLENERRLATEARLRHMEVLNMCGIMDRFLDPVHSDLRVRHSRNANIYCVFIDAL